MRMVLQFDIVLDQSVDQRPHVRLILKRLELSWLVFDRQVCDAERLLHQMQIAAPKYGHAVTLSREDRTTAQGCLKKTQPLFRCHAWASSTILHLRRGGGGRRDRQNFVSRRPPP
jgi:hypothetical protein